MDLYQNSLYLNRPCGVRCHVLFFFQRMTALDVTLQRFTRAFKLVPAATLETFRNATLTVTVTVGGARGGDVHLWHQSINQSIELHIGSCTLLGLLLYFAIYGLPVRNKKLLW